jgi:hypothetical protein
VVPKVIDTEIIVEDSHFEYLVLQKGRLDAVKKQRAIWHALYQRDLRSTYDEIKPFLPDRCFQLLDIGSGLGGIDVLLYRHYEWTPDVEIVHKEWLRGPYVVLLDGENDPPVMNLHRQTFNNMRVAQDFQTKNGVPSNRFMYYTPDSEIFATEQFDLIVSFGSWCFHYEPNVYLDRLLKHGGARAGTRLIVDLRSGRPQWAEQLNERLTCVAVIREARKFVRLAYDVK